GGRGGRGVRVRGRGKGAVRAVKLAAAMPTVTFHGACGVVTGSSTHLDWGEHKVLVDCGLYQGGEELELRNWNPFPYPPARGTPVGGATPTPRHTGRPRACPAR